MEQNEFINLVKEGAVKAQKEYGICASMTIAQAILESGWGQYTQGNNLFGIKWAEGCGYDKQLLNTTEYYDGVKTNIQDYFRAYNSLGDSLYDHTMFLIKNSRYANLRGLLDYKQACRLIQEDGYATAPDYSDMLVRIIEQYNLNEFDKIEEEFDMENLIIYSGDGDLATAQLLSYKIGAPVISRSAYIGNIKAKNILVVGGSWIPDGVNSKLLSGNGRMETAEVVINYIKSL